MYNIDQYYFKHKAIINAIRYRGKDTKGYNVTPNFFIRNGVPEGTPDGHIDYSDRHLKANKNIKEGIQKQFEDRL